MTRIGGDNFFLRSWKISDAEWYLHARDEKVFKWTTEIQDLTIEQIEIAIKEVNRNAKTCCFAIVDRQTERLMGSVALVIADGSNEEAEIMYWLAPEGRGRGLATKSVQLLCQWAFYEKNITHILLKTHQQNLASQKVAQRAAFKRVSEDTAKKGNQEFIWFERFCHAAANEKNCRRITSQ